MENRFNRMGIPMPLYNIEPSRGSSVPPSYNYNHPKDDNQHMIFHGPTPSSLRHFQPANLSTVNPVNIPSMSDYHKQMHYHQSEKASYLLNNFNQYNPAPQHIPLPILTGRDIAWANTAPFYPSKDVIHSNHSNINEYILNYKANYDESKIVDGNGQNSLVSEDEDDDDDDDDASDIKSIKTNITASTRSSRPSIREHSKAQREKRKLYIMHLEERATFLSNELVKIRQRVEEDYETLAVVHDAFYSQIEIFLQLLFQGEIENKENIINEHFNKTNKAITESSSNKTWNDVLESDDLGGFHVFVPLLNFAYQPSHSVDKTLNRLNITAFSELDIYAQGLRTAYETIARIGTNLAKQLLMTIQIVNKSYFVVKNIAMLQFYLISKNARLLGGHTEIKIKVFARMEFSCNRDRDKLKTVELYFDSLDFHKQLAESFSPTTYRPITIRNFKISGEQGTLQGLCQMVTSINNYSILSLNPYAKILFDSKIKHLSINNEFVDTIKENTRKWLPFSAYINDLNELCQTNFTKRTNCSYYIQIYPFYCDTALTNTTISSENKVIVPNRLFWIIHQCRPINDLNLSAYLMYDFLERVIDLFDRGDYNELNTLVSHQTTSTSSSSSISNAANNHISPINRIVKLAIDISEKLSHLLVDNQVQLFDKKHLLYELIHEFLKWVSLVDTITNQDNDSDNKPINNTINIEDENITNLNNQDNFMFTSSKFFLSALEKSMIHALLQELNNFFVQIRESNLISRLLYLLWKADNEEQIKNGEGFIFLCWTRHTNLTIQLLLNQTRKCILYKKFDEALESISKIIEIDSNFAEAYNKRATVYFGMKRPQECFDDIDVVLKLEPYHYGALCGKGLMLMKLGEFASAIDAFQSAIAINPSLKSGSLGKTLAFCQDRLASLQHTKKENASMLPPITVPLTLSNADDNDDRINQDIVIPINDNIDVNSDSNINEI